MFPYTQVVHASERNARILRESYAMADRIEARTRCGDYGLNLPLPPPLPAPPNLSAEEFSAMLRRVRYDSWDREDDILP